MSYLAGHSILFLSALTPAMLWIRLAWSHGGHQHPTSSRLRSLPIETCIRKHFQYIRKRNVKLKNGNEVLEGYFEAYPNGTYFFYHTDHTELIRLKKDHLGWAVVDIRGNDTYLRKFITPLILKLEERIFN